MVNFPKYITRFAKLWFLKFVNCKQFGEKVGLPRNIVCAMRSSHQYSTSESMACKMDLTCNLALPGSKIPNWFNHQSVGSSIYSSINGCKRQHANYRLLLDSSTIMFFHYIRLVDSSMKPIILGDRNEVTIKRCKIHVACICPPRNSKEACVRIHERLKVPFDERLKVFLSKVAAEFLPF